MIITQAEPEILSTGFKAYKQIESDRTKHHRHHDQQGTKRRHQGRHTRSPGWDMTAIDTICYQATTGDVPVTHEATGNVAKDSLAAESVRRGGEFAANPGQEQ